MNRLLQGPAKCLGYFIALKIRLLSQYQQQDACSLQELFLNCFCLKISSYWPQSCKWQRQLSSTFCAPFPYQHQNACSGQPESNLMMDGIHFVFVLSLKIHSIGALSKMMLPQNIRLLTAVLQVSAILSASGQCMSVLDSTGIMMDGKPNYI